MPGLDERGTERQHDSSDRNLQRHVARQTRQSGQRSHASCRGSRLDRSGECAKREPQALGAIRFLGIVTMGAGVGLFFLLVIIDRWEPAVGIGGLMLIVGATLILTTIRAVRVRGDR